MEKNNFKQKSITEKSVAERQNTNEVGMKLKCEPDANSSQMQKQKRNYKKKKVKKKKKKLIINKFTRWCGSQEIRGVLAV